MSAPLVTRGDIDAAVASAVEMLRDGLDARLTYHSLLHTAEEVVPAVQVLAAGEGVGRRDASLLVIAAWFHDTGYIAQTEGHELVGADIAGNVLPHLGFDEAEVALIQSLILATRVPQQPTTALQRILCDADLCSLGLASFDERSQALRRELELRTGDLIPAKEWACRQAGFLADHRWWTATAHGFWAKAEAQHLQVLQRRCQEG